MKKLNILSIVFVILAILLFAMKALSPEYIDEDGILHENFFLLVGSWSSMFLAGVTAIISAVSAWVRRKDKTPS